MAHSVKLRMLVVEAYKAKRGTYPQLAKLYGVSVASVSRWLRAERESGRVSPNHGGGTRPAIDSDGLEIVKQIVEEQNDLTLPEIAQEYARRTGSKVGRMVIVRALKKLGISRKKKTVRAEERDKEETQKQRAEHRRLLQRISFTWLVFLDEMGVNLKMNRTHARSLRNTRARDSSPGGYKKNISVLGALTKEGLTALMMLPGSFDGPAFLVYLKEVLGPILIPGQIVVMDNVRFHKVEGVEEIIGSFGCAVLYQPPYSPDLNPIEECWSKIKTALRGAKARAMEVLEFEVAQAAKTVTPQDAMGWFGHSLVTP